MWRQIDALQYSAKWTKKHSSLLAQEWQYRALTNVSTAFVAKFYYFMTRFTVCISLKDLNHATLSSLVTSTRPFNNWISLEITCSNSNFYQTDPNRAETNHNSMFVWIKCNILPVTWHTSCTGVLSIYRKKSPKEKTKHHKKKSTKKSDR